MKTDQCLRIGPQMATGFMLAHPYGSARVMSSYYWPEDYQNGEVR